MTAATMRVAELPPIGAHLRLAERSIPEPPPGQGRARAVDIFWRELSVLGSRGFIPDDIRDAIDLYLDGTIDVRHLVESVRPLEEANAALEDLKAGRVFRSVLAPT